MVISERQQKILEILLANRVATVAQLTELFGVSGVTIRNDLNQLQQQGQVIRVHGGAQIVDGRVRQELTYATRERLNSDRKQRIGELAATLIRPPESILLDASTTAMAVGRAIKSRPDLQDITVVTTGIWTAIEMIDSPNVNVVLAGGVMRHSTGSLTGSTTLQMLSSFHFNKVFLGAWGLTLEEGLTDTHLLEVELKRAIVERAQQVIAVLDGSKFGRLGLASFANIRQISQVVTDDTAPPEMAQCLREHGIEVLIASTENTP